MLLLRRFVSVLSVLMIVLGAPASVCAQSWELPKAEVFGGYSWYHAGGTVNKVNVPDFTKGWAGEVTLNANRWSGIAIDVNGHYNNSGHAYDFALGPQFKLRRGPFIPFAELMLGVQAFSPKGYTSQNAATYIFGGGMDVRVSPRFTVRAIQFDYVNTYYTALSPSGQGNSFNGARMQAGMVFNLGLPPKPGPVSATCSADPQALDTGDAVKIVVTPRGFLPKRVLTFAYESTGGKIVGDAATATVDTAGLVPGSYKVTARVVDDGKANLKRMAACEVGFTINEPPKHPPELAVLAEPGAVKTGENLTVTARASSRDERPLSYNCTASAGQLTGNGPAYKLETAGVPDGNITIHCTVSDDRNLSASSEATVKVSAPVKTAAPPAAKFGTIAFKHDAKRPARVNNEAKGELDRYADALAAAPDAKAVIVGYASGMEGAPKKGSAKNSSLAAQRAVNTKDYVGREKGIDPLRIEVRTGTGDEQNADLWIVPAGATFAVEGTQAVDEAGVKAVPRVAAKKKPAARQSGKK